jgi:hypothetical protein
MHCGHGRVDIVKQLVGLDLFNNNNNNNSEICVVEVKNMLKHARESKYLFHSIEDFTNCFIFITLF